REEGRAQERLRTGEQQALGCGEEGLGDAAEEGERLILPPLPRAGGAGGGPASRPDPPLTPPASGRGTGRDGFGAVTPSPRGGRMATAAQNDAEELTAERILANARALAPAISARSEEIEALRRLPDDLVADLRTAGFFRMGRSRAKGGPQMTLRQHLEVIEVLARADPSVGWCVKIGTDSGLIAEFLPPDASARLLPEPDMITAGQFTTGHGKLEPVEGGYVLNG